MRLRLSLGMLLVTALTTLVWIYSNYVQTAITETISQQVLLIVSIVSGVIFILAGFKDVIELVGSFRNQDSSEQMQPDPEQETTQIKLDITGNVIINSPLARPLNLAEITDSNLPLHNLPQPDYQNFIGREKEIAEIVRTLQPYPHSQHPAISIDGIGGIGKSALALEIALRYLYRYKQLSADEQFAAIVWATAKHTILTADGVKRRSQTIDSLDSIYTTIAVTLNRENITRAQIAKQDMLIRQALTEQRTLLIIDNLETIDDERVLSFIREVPAPTKVIVTTRHRIDVARTVRLIGMPELDALKLISETANAKEVVLGVQESKRLYERTGGVPLAIVWSLARIGFGYTIENVLTELSYPHSDIAKFCFDSIVKGIRNQPSYKLLLALSLFEIDASRDSLGVVADLPELDRDEGLVELERLSLVNKAGSRFSMLPLTRNYVVEEARQNPDFTMRATQRWAKHLINLVGQSPEKYWIQDQATILQEGENFYSLLEWSTKQQDFIGFLQIVRFAVLYLQYTGRRVEAQKLALDGQEIARQHNDIALQAWLCADVGWMLSQQEAHTEAIKQIEESIRIYQLLSNQRGICFANCLLAQALRHVGTINDAKSLLLEVNEEASHIGYKEGIALAQFELGKLAREDKDWDRAYVHFKEAYLAISALIEGSFADIFSLAILGNFGSAALNLGKLEEAKAATLKVLDVLEVWREKSFASNYTARMCLQAARIERELYNYVGAKKYAELAALIYESTKNQTGYQEAKIFLGLLPA